MVQEKKLSENFLLDSVEKIIVGIVLLTMLVLVISQGLLMIPWLAGEMNWAHHLEGEPLKEEELIYLAGNISSTPWALINLRLTDHVSLPGVKVLVDGSEISSFLQRDISITVKQGSIISVQNPNPDLSVTIEVAQKTPNIIIPEINDRVVGQGLLFFDPVVIK